GIGVAAVDWRMCYGASAERFSSTRMASSAPPASTGTATGVCSCPTLSSRAFFFHENGVERAAGVDWHCDRRLLLSYTVGDNEAWLAAVNAGEVRGALDDTLSFQKSILTSVGKFGKSD